MDHTPRQDYMACTEKYQSQVKLLPDHTVGNYVCGQPFPNSSLKEGRPGLRLEDGCGITNIDGRAFGFSLTMTPATWDRFGGTHDVPQWELPPNRLAEQRRSGLNRTSIRRCRPETELKMIYGGGGNFQRTLDAFYRKGFCYTHLAMLENHTLARARRGELRVQRVHRLLLAL